MNAMKMMTVKDVQSYLNVCERTVFKMIKNKSIPCLKVCGVWRFEKAKVDEWKDRQYCENGVLPDYDSKLKVLVVDDDPTIAEIVGDSILSYLEDNSEVRIAQNGVQALLEVGKRKPDVMILDIEMPDLNGIEVCRRLKEIPETSDIFIIAITGHEQKGYEERILAAGANKFLLKPFGIMVVVDLIKQSMTR